ncbi:D-ribitol-5-phosphate cytidylyltransferase [Chanos chanos]|uniref:D-ribitol-5-phosphate cytidylyltransferase n=1 Tax=Chanos chanos TaxID=29144 RepID=A0A6J2W4R1_CHACN|nr:D-ribitol-5-phosphate cytidylyltransferase [Chanos chanos]XP_030638351.1 D-ribitol-5-phosphate cytidylyltransferase [Chanos chanos]
MPDRPLYPGYRVTPETELREQMQDRCTVDFPVAVVLPAGGSGERTGLTTPKQFVTVLNRPLISYTIQAFERVSWIKAIVVVVAKETQDLMQSIVHKFHHVKVKVVQGGSTRHRSIYNGLQALSEQTDGSAFTKPKVVIIHDAVRPFVEEDLLLKVTMAAKDQGASGVIRPLVSTVIATTTEGYLDHSLERAKYRASEMPQGFLYDVICQAYQRCSEFDFEFGTECLHLALHYCNTNAKLIEGLPTQFKVTYKRDLAAVESIFKETLSQSVCIITGGSAELAGKYQKHLSAHNVAVDIKPNTKGSNTVSLSKTWNFIQVSVNTSSLCEILDLVQACEESSHSLLYPVVIVWVLLKGNERTCPSQKTDESVTVKDLAAELLQRNVLLYGVSLDCTVVPEQLERSMERLCQITLCLIKDRNPALTGQLLEV